MALSKKERAQLFAMFDGRCAYCGQPLPVRGWHADHIAPVYRKLKSVTDKNGYYRLQSTGECWRPENERIDNLFPSCHVCNIDKSCADIETWRRCLADKVGILRRNYSAFRLAERYGMVSVSEPVSIVFHFEAIAAKQEAQSYEAQMEAQHD